MLKFKLIENNDELVSYRYFPEGKEEYGFLTVNKKDNSVIEHQIAKSDCFKRYYFHMLYKIEEFIEINKFEEEGIVAWY